ncbi:uracil-DNA glycosylase [Pseudoduganella sp. R-32]|uniref:uracil-DNA glycosylase n=1 Tax=Pseudoduganella sp. R-32 TaxID=3404061 RepID=UPI003CEEDFA3
MSDRRSAVFLEEMGVGPQWRLRNRPVAADAAGAGEVDDAFADAQPAPAAVQFAPAAGQQLPAAQQEAAALDPAPAAGLAPAAPPRPPANAQSPAAAAAAAARAASTAPGAATGARQAPPIPPAPDAQAAPAPAAPVRVPGTPSIASTGEDMSWFDDAPTPEYKPQRKKVAAPEQPAETPPQRPAPAARPAPTPPRTAGVPAYDDIPMDEPPSWFDEEQTPRGAATAVASAPAPGGATDEQIAQMDWPALRAAIASCTRCGRCQTRQQAVPGRGDEQATWIALDTAPGQAEDAEGYQFAGDPGYLLDNMLKAVGQVAEKGAYLTSLVKCHAPHAPGAEELQACRPYLQRELELTQAKVIVAFGHSTGKGLLGGAARGRIMLHGAVPVVATYHPADLLKKPEEKAKAWQDLCLAKAAHAGRR